MLLDANLTELGRKYAKALAKFIDCFSLHDFYADPIQFKDKSSESMN